MNARLAVLGRLPALPLRERAAWAAGRSGVAAGASGRMARGAAVRVRGAGAGAGGGRSGLVESDSTTVLLRPGDAARLSARTWNGSPSTSAERIGRSEQRHLRLGDAAARRRRVAAKARAVESGRSCRPELARRPLEPARQQVGVGAGAGQALAELRHRSARRPGSAAPGSSTWRARSGKCVVQPVLEDLLAVRAAAAAAHSRRARAPPCAAASRIFSNSASFSPGIIGAASTPAGTPARASSATACSRRAGVAARGSITRASAASSVVTDRYTRTSLRCAIERRISRSRSTPADLVTMLTGWLKRSSTSSTARVSFSVRSTGW